MTSRIKNLLISLLLCSSAISFSPALNDGAEATKSSKASIQEAAGRRAPVLGADQVYADFPHTMIHAWHDKAESDAMAKAFKAAGLKSLRFSFHGFYSPMGVDATEAVKAENRLQSKEFPWFSFDSYLDFIASNDFTTVVGINVEEGPKVAASVVEKIKEKGIESKLVAIELSNEPWLNHRPWMPEDYAARAADVIEALTPLGVRFALPLTVGKENKTPTKLSDNEWNERMLRALSSRIDLKTRSDIYGVAHLYSRGVRAKSIDYFNEAVKPFAPQMRYLVTEFNIRLFLTGNPHLTNEYALEFAQKLAELMAHPDIEALYVHGVPYHAIMYWVGEDQVATVIGQRDPKLQGKDLEMGWHITPAGKVYRLYSELAWNGEILTYIESGKQSYWAVKANDGRVVVTLLNTQNKSVSKRVKIAGKDLNLTAPAESIVCYDINGQEIEQLSLKK